MSIFYGIPQAREQVNNKLPRYGFLANKPMVGIAKRRLHSVCQVRPRPDTSQQF
jgi:hypothetical protein